MTVGATIADALARYGYLAVFLVVAIESVGVPFPGETALITGAALAASGRLSIVGVVIAAAAGAIIGGTGGYWIGRSGGSALIARYGRLVRMTPERLQRLHAFFDKYGAPAVFIGRFVAVLRAWAAILAGTAQMAFATFFLYNTLGAIVWAAVFGALGYVFGHSLPALQHNLGLATVVLAGAAAIAGAIYYVTYWRKKHGTSSARSA